jgi:hypothetical protein
MLWLADIRIRASQRPLRAQMRSLQVPAGTTISRRCIDKANMDGLLDNPASGGQVMILR